MAFFNDIGKKITQTGQDAVKNTKNLADISRLNSLISEEQKLMNSFYMQIGKKYYEMSAGNPSDDFAQQCASISESMAKITAYRDDIQRIKGIKKCSACGAEVPATTAFCGFCGHDTTAASASEATTEAPLEAASEGKKCSNCNRNLPDGVAFCTECGQKV